LRRKATQNEKRSKPNDDLLYDVHLHPKLLRPKAKDLIFIIVQTIALLVAIQKGFFISKDFQYFKFLKIQKPDDPKIQNLISQY